MRLTNATLVFLIVLALGLAILTIIFHNIVLGPPPESVADRAAAGMAQMFDGSPWNRMAAEEVTW